MGRRVRGAGLLTHALLLFMSFLFLVPFYIAVISAFKTRVDILTRPLAIPFARLTLDNLLRNLDSPNFNILIGYGTSLVLSTLTVLLVTLAASAMSFVISRGRHPFLKVSYLLLLAGLLVPAQVILLPIVQILRRLHLMSTVPGLLLANLAWYLPFAAFIFVGYIRTIPVQLDESAKMDGAREARIFFRIVLPLIGPAVASVVIFVALWTWNDFVNPLIILGSSRFYTVTIGVYRAVGQYTQKWDDVFAIVLLAILPVAIFYLFMQQYFISGMTTGALKA
jgi:raffinose/stachyose/melibiose transport system permease protein